MRAPCVFRFRIVGSHYAVRQSCDSRFSSAFFLDSCVSDGTHGCCYLLATDMDTNSVAGYRVAGWQQGYGDLHFVPDMKTLRRASW